MTEPEAAQKIANLLNEIQAAGIQVDADPDGDGIWVGNNILIRRPWATWPAWKVEQ